MGSTMNILGELNGHRDAFNHMKIIGSTSIKAKEGMQRARIKYCAKKMGMENGYQGSIVPVAGLKLFLQEHWDMI